MGVGFGFGFRFGFGLANEPFTASLLSVPLCPVQTAGIIGALRLHLAVPHVLPFVEHVEQLVEQRRGSHGALT